MARHLLLFKLLTILKTIGVASILLASPALKGQSTAPLGEECALNGDLARLILDHAENGHLSRAEEKVFLKERRTHRLVEIVFSRRDGRRLPEGAVWVRGRMKGKAFQVPDNGANHLRPGATVDPTVKECAAPAAGESAAGAAAQTPSAVVIDSGVDLAQTPTNGAGVSFGQTFKLHSNPGSKYKVYLDFDGHTTTGTSWNGYWSLNSFYSPAFTLDGSEAFTASELTVIQQTWMRAVEYFSPFNVDVTTEEPGAENLAYSGSNDSSFGIRVIITSGDGRGYGGIAWVGSFDWSTDTGVFVYSSALGNNNKYVADALAHEVGHSMGLDHDGQSSSQYYYGHGSGATSWAPIMGVGYNVNLVQWSNGAYLGATNTQPDLEIITTQNSGVNFRADDFGNTFSTARLAPATVTSGMASVKAYGVLSGTSAQKDVDMLALRVSAGGSIDLQVDSWARVHAEGATTWAKSAFSMVDVKATLYGPDRQPLLVVNDPNRLDARVTLANLAAGTYYLAVEGAGLGDPQASLFGYTDYGSIGQYQISGIYSFDESAPPEPTCVPAQPEVTLAPSYQSARAGLSLTYTLTVRNRDSMECLASTFSASAALPAGFQAGAVPDITLNPGAGTTLNLLVTSAATAQPGDYGFTVTIVNPAQAAHSVAARATYAVVPGDALAPSAPTGLQVSLVNGVPNLRWNAAADNVGVVAYVIHRNRSAVGRTATTSYVDTALKDGKYNYVIYAVDAAGNQSPASNSVTITIRSTTRRK